MESKKNGHDVDDLQTDNGTLNTIKLEQCDTINEEMTLTKAQSIKNYRKINHNNISKYSMKKLTKTGHFMKKDHKKLLKQIGVTPNEVALEYNWYKSHPYAVFDPRTHAVPMGRDTARGDDQNITESNNIHSIKLHLLSVEMALRGMNVVRGKDKRNALEKLTGLKKVMDLVEVEVKKAKNWSLYTEMIVSKLNIMDMELLLDPHRYRSTQWYKSRWKEMFVIGRLEELKRESDRVLRKRYEKISYNKLRKSMKNVLNPDTRKKGIDINSAAMESNKICEAIPEEDYMDDIIVLMPNEGSQIAPKDTNIDNIVNHGPQSNVNNNNEESVQDEALARPKPPQKNYMLPVTFFDNSRNIRLLTKCRPMCIKLVDYVKNPSCVQKKISRVFAATNRRPPYRSYFMKYPSAVLDVETSKDNSVKLVDCDKSLVANNTSFNSNNNATLDPKQCINIDLKKNIGLVGLKIAHKITPISQDKNSILKMNTVDVKSRTNISLKPIKVKENINTLNRIDTNTSSQPEPNIHIKQDKINSLKCRLNILPILASTSLLEKLNKEGNEKKNEDNNQNNNELIEVNTASECVKDMKMFYRTSITKEVKHPKKKTEKYTKSKRKIKELKHTKKVHRENKIKDRRIKKNLSQVLNQDTGHYFMHSKNIVANINCQSYPPGLSNINVPSNTNVADDTNNNKTNNLKHNNTLITLSGTNQNHLDLKQHWNGFKEPLCNLDGNTVKISQTHSKNTSVEFNKQTEPDGNRYSKKINNELDTNNKPTDLINGEANVCEIKVQTVSQINDKIGKALFDRYEEKNMGYNIQGTVESEINIKREDDNNRSNTSLICHYEKTTQRPHKTIPYYDAEHKTNLNVTHVYNNVQPISSLQINSSMSLQNINSNLNISEDLRRNQINTKAAPGLSIPASNIHSKNEDILSRHYSNVRTVSHPPNDKLNLQHKIPQNRPHNASLRWPNPPTGTVQNVVNPNYFPHWQPSAAQYNSNDSWVQSQQMSNTDQRRMNNYYYSVHRNFVLPPPPPPPPTPQHPPLLSTPTPQTFNAAGHHVIQNSSYKSPKKIGVITSHKMELGRKSNDINNRFRTQYKPKLIKHITGFNRNKDVNPQDHGIDPKIHSEKSIPTQRKQMCTESPPGSCWTTEKVTVPAGYSPPILPIPSVQKSMELLSMITTIQNQNLVNNHPDQVPKRPQNKTLKPKTIGRNNFLKVTSEELKKRIQGYKNTESYKKISLDEYKNRRSEKYSTNSIDLTDEDQMTTKCYLNKNKKRFDNVGRQSLDSQDLGYDSDSTVKL